MDAGAVQICGTADLMLGVLDTAHLMVCACVQRTPESDDDQAAKVVSRVFNLGEGPPP